MTPCGSIHRMVFFDIISYFNSFYLSYKNAPIFLAALTILFPDSFFPLIYEK